MHAFGDLSWVMTRPSEQRRIIAQSARGGRVAIGADAQ